MKVKLRYPELHDAGWMLAQEHTPDAVAYADYDADFSLADVKNFIDLNRTGADPSQARLIIEADGKPAGMIDLTGISKRNGHADIGILVGSEYRGKGVGTEALREAIQIAAMMGIFHIKALISSANQSSVSLFEKVGFEKIGKLPGWLNHGHADGIIYYLSIMGDDFDTDMGSAESGIAGDEFSLYGFDETNPYSDDFDENSYGAGFPDDGEPGFDSLDDYIDKI